MTDGAPVYIIKPAAKRPKWPFRRLALSLFAAWFIVILVLLVTTHGTVCRTEGSFVCTHLSFCLVTIVAVFALIGCFSSIRPIYEYHQKVLLLSMLRYVCYSDRLEAPDITVSRNHMHNIDLACDIGKDTGDIYIEYTTSDADTPDDEAKTDSLELINIPEARTVFTKLKYLYDLPQKNRLATLKSDFKSDRESSTIRNI